ncbi:MAG: RNA-binding cell elongation regulator Jag/EloR [Chloroflexota bacterium]
MNQTHAFIEIIAPDMEQAVARGLEELGLLRDEVKVEVLDEGDPSEGRQARVRLTVRDLENEDEDPDIAASRQVLQELLDKMRVRAHVSALWGEPAGEDEERPLLLDVHGDDLGMLIGRKGETLAALQYIVRLIVNKQLNTMLNIVVDVEGYKQRREQQLIRLANRLAEQATQRGQTMTLEPMPANERRIIHITLRDHPQVTTESIGEGSGRKVTIIPRQT